MHAKRFTVGLKNLDKCGNRFRVPSALCIQWDIVIVTRDDYSACQHKNPGCHFVH